MMAGTVCNKGRKPLGEKKPKKKEKCRGVPEKGLPEEKKPKKFLCCIAEGGKMW